MSLGQDPLDTLAGLPDSGGKVGSKQGFWETSGKMSILYLVFNRKLLLCFSKI